MPGGGRGQQRGAACSHFAPPIFVPTFTGSTLSGSQRRDLCPGAMQAAGHRAGLGRCLSQNSTMRLALPVHRCVGRHPIAPAALSSSQSAACSSSSAHTSSLASTSGILVALRACRSACTAALFVSAWAYLSQGAASGPFASLAMGITAGAGGAFRPLATCRTLHACSMHGAQPQRCRLHCRRGSIYEDCLDGPGHRRPAHALWARPPSGEPAPQDPPSLSCPPTPDSLS